MLRLIIWIVVLYLLYRILSTWLLPWMGKRYVDHAREKYGRQQNKARHINMENGDGHIIIPGDDPKRSQQKPKEDREYTPFEEA